MKFLITGGTGSLGRELVKTLLNEKKATKIFVFSRDEGKHAKYFPNIPEVKCYIGNVRDYERLEEVVRRTKPDVIIHTAALKRIENLEENPIECWKTNVLGSQNVCRAAEINGVKKTILISTDKACMPINVYGASKFTAEKIFSKFSLENERSQFASCRYGNVIASRGSFIPLWLEKSSNKETISITQKECTRFLFTLNDAVSFVLKSIESMRGLGETFVPNLKSYKILDVFETVKDISKNQELIFKEVGIRPGEKIHEDMISDSEALRAWEIGTNKNIIAILPPQVKPSKAFVAWDATEEKIENNLVIVSKPIGVQKYPKKGYSSNESLDLESNVLTNLIKRGLDEA